MNIVCAEDCHWKSRALAFAAALALGWVVMGVKLVDARHTIAEQAEAIEQDKQVLRSATGEMKEYQAEMERATVAVESAIAEQRACHCRP